MGVAPDTSTTTSSTTTTTTCQTTTTKKSILKKSSGSDATVDPERENLLENDSESESEPEQPVVIRKAPSTPKMLTKSGITKTCPLTISEKVPQPPLGASSSSGGVTMQRAPKNQQPLLLFPIKLEPLKANTSPPHNNIRGNGAVSSKEIQTSSILKSTSNVNKKFERSRDPQMKKSEAATTTTTEQQPQSTTTTTTTSCPNSSCRYNAPSNTAVSVSSQKVFCVCGKIMEDKKSEEKTADDESTSCSNVTTTTNPEDKTAIT